MPKLLLFAPCEKVLFDSTDESPSLINVFHGLDVTATAVSPQVKAGTEMPAGTAMPLRWCVFTIWKRIDEDEGKTYEQLCRLQTPSGRIAMEVSIKFRMDKSYQRNTVRVSHFPIDERGEYQLKILLREGEKKPSEIATYPIPVTHAIPGITAKKVQNATEQTSSSG